MKRFALALLGCGILLTGCEDYVTGYGTPNWAVYSDDPAHTPPPAINLPAYDYVPYGPPPPYHPS